MAKWEKWGFGGRENENIETLKPCDGLEIILTNMDRVPDWNIVISFNKGPICFKQEYVAIPDPGEEYTWPVMRAKAEELAKEYLTALSDIADSGLTALSEQ